MEDVPDWFKVLNLEAGLFERSKLLADNPDSKGKFRLKDLNVLREVAPRTYEVAAQEVKEYNDALFETKGQVRKYKLGRKIGSIPMLDAALHPELMNDPKAQDRYFQEHPEMKTRG